MSSLRRKTRRRAERQCTTNRSQPSTYIPHSETIRQRDMCKHVLNAQVAIRAPCCKQWFDCAKCHAETQSHRLAKTSEMAFLCKKCKKAFRKDMTEYDESDEYCPHCDNHYVSPYLILRVRPRWILGVHQVIEAKTPQAVLGVEGEDPRLDSRMLKDDRVEEDPARSLFSMEFSDRIG
ncbi:hypothetical protein C8Q80DRAFT_217648 [Daedaleopsis nitida]|nr:hypothetical protein C8Q80DRAFT_217648 [Daedaleopsis nitida]